MKLFKKKNDRTWDFEGRCAECAKSLKLTITIVKKTEIKINVEECEEHPESSFILWPIRDDILDRYLKEKENGKP